MLKSEELEGIDNLSNTSIERGKDLSLKTPHSPLFIRGIVTIY